MLFLAHILFVLHQVMPQQLQGINHHHGVSKVKRKWRFKSSKSYAAFMKIDKYN